MRRRIRWTLLLVVGVLLALDLARPPERQVTARVELAAIELYQATLSGRLAARCRFEPTCSHYGAAVIRHHGFLRGNALAAWRILRCGPWTPVDTEDPPPVPTPPAAETARPEGL